MVQIDNKIELKDVYGRYFCSQLSRSLFTFLVQRDIIQIIVKTAGAKTKLLLTGCARAAKAIIWQQITKVRFCVFASLMSHYFLQLYYLPLLRLQRRIFDILTYLGHSYVVQVCEIMQIIQFTSKVNLTGQIRSQ
ncbi:Hypothetical_protein [Hexamita inflata]|uniref:Hypothetical_protein n=1 Tax=Hexamita inflata TaxID=28002 RepID=A0AA86QD70_9EUKA|nr:Hypothetical protein HINF_LOCUS18928 [Hexamita inflata]CAI9957119.1 Hypothetical protein HINF_LOCUS44764 [Hexamita inflata]